MVLLVHSVDVAISIQRIPNRYETEAFAAAKNVGIVDVELSLSSRRPERYEIQIATCSTI